MAVWQENLQWFLSQKEVLILHGNVRDTAYIKQDGTLVKGLTALLREVGKALNFQRAVFWGVAFDHEGKGHMPPWSLERIELLDGGAQPEIRNTGSEAREMVVLSRWLKEEIRDRDRKTLFVIHYLDKLTPYSRSGVYPRDIVQLLVLIQKLIENIADANRLVLVALDDTLIPLEYYTHSPRVAVMPIPLPDRAERSEYFKRQLTGRRFTREQIDFLGNITDGLYVRDLENILSGVVEAQAKLPELSHMALRRVVNRYRIGSEEDPWAQLPLTDSDKALINDAEIWFQQRVIGQDHAVAEVVLAVKKARAGVVGLASGQATKPKAVFFFAGPTGVGKTFLAKKLAEYLFDTEEAFIRFDMSEFKEEHTVSKLIGAPPGYVGYEKGGELTNAVRSRPFAVVLFDETEKAHPKIMDLFLQILDDGRLTDSRGQTVFFTEAVIIFTSNLGTRTTNSAGKAIDEKTKLENLLAIPTLPERAAKVREHFVSAVQDFFSYEISRPELLNRIGNRIVAFNYIDAPEAMQQMIAVKLQDMETEFRERFAHLGYRLTLSEELAGYFLERYQTSIQRYGGRGVVNAIEDEVTRVLTDQKLYAEKFGQDGVNFLVSCNPKGGLRCERKS